MGRGWNVAEAKRLLAASPRDPHPLVVNDFNGFFMKTQNISPETVASADLNVPIIVVRVENSWLPIDGWHRIARAIQCEIAKLPSVRLSKAEEAKIVYRC